MKLRLPKRHLLTLLIFSSMSLLCFLPATLAQEELELGKKAFDDGFYEIATRARDLGEAQRAWVEENAVLSFNEVLERRPWEAVCAEKV